MCVVSVVYYCDDETNQKTVRCISGIPEYPAVTAFVGIPQEAEV